MSTNETRLNRLERARQPEHERPVIEMWRTDWPTGQRVNLRTGERLTRAAWDARRDVRPFTITIPKRGSDHEQQ